MVAPAAGGGGSMTEDSGVLAWMGRGNRGYRPCVSMVPETDDDARVLDSCMRNFADSIVAAEGSLPPAVCPSVSVVLSRVVPTRNPVDGSIAGCGELFSTLSGIDSGLLPTIDASFVSRNSGGSVMGLGWFLGGLMDPNVVSSSTRGGGCASLSFFGCGCWGFESGNPKRAIEDSSRVAVDGLQQSIVYQGDSAAYRLSTLEKGKGVPGPTRLPEAGDGNDQKPEPAYDSSKSLVMKPFTLQRRKQEKMHSVYKSYVSN
ncbi:hypothetical protein NE237_003914 [Protea cynaroides]|uniref:Uncharacterized protein n=1 Tax=Protea cynaroides TaxID=273540 RepID=A0A9Q0QT23_9MAGN|nr:hypothetical protein NE237_003914 [Protea cynaroides]